MILKVADDYDRWWFFDLDGYINYKEIDSKDISDYSFTLIFQDIPTDKPKGLILNFYTKNGKEETLFINTDAYLLNDEGKTIEVLYR